MRSKLVHSHLLLMRWLCLNVVLGILLIYADREGLVERAWTSDTTWVSTSIVVLFVIGWVGTLWRIAQCTHWLDELKYPTNTEAFKTKLASRVRPYVWLARCMVMLGFFGTVYGMITALGLISASGVQDAAMAMQILSALVSGFNIALWTTITGIVCYFALMFNIQLLMGGYERLYTKSLEL